MLDSVEAFRRLLWIILLTGLGAVIATFAGLIISRLVRRSLAARRDRVRARYQDTVNGLMRPGTAAAAVRALAAAPRAHHDVIGGMLLRPLAVARGDLIDSVRAAAAAMGRDRVWRERLGDRRWWMRADAVRALGLIRERDALPALAAALEDDHDEVRAAAIESIGLIGDAAAIPTLLARLASESRHQRVRVVEALRAFGPGATPALISHARKFPDDRLAVTTVLGQIGGPDALPSLVDWMSDPDSAVRAAAVAAAGAIGLDDRAFYFVLKALKDDAVAVRAAAARSVARAARPGVAAYLDPLLDDAWDVAMQAALSLKRLGREGLDVLGARAKTEGPAADLAGQMLWEGSAMKAGGVQP